MRKFFIALVTLVVLAFSFNLVASDYNNIYSNKFKTRAEAVTQIKADLKEGIADTKKLCEDTEKNKNIMSLETMDPEMKKMLAEMDAETRKMFEQSLSGGVGSFAIKSIYFVAYDLKYGYAQKKLAAKLGTRNEKKIANFAKNKPKEFLDFVVQMQKDFKYPTKDPVKLCWEAYEIIKSF